MIQILTLNCNKRPRFFAKRNIYFLLINSLRDKGDAIQFSTISKFCQIFNELQSEGWLLINVILSLFGGEWLLFGTYMWSKPTLKHADSGRRFAFGIPVTTNQVRNISEH